MRTTVIVVALALFSAAPAMARDQLPYEATHKYELKDGSTVYVFKDGKMAKEDRLGRPQHLKPGEVLVLKDGRKVTANGNEVERLRGHVEHDLRG